MGVRFGGVALALVCASIGFGQDSAPPVPERKTFFISNAKIVVGDGTTIEGGTIVVRDGKIAAVGTNLEVPTDATRIDAKGLTIYPGFIDGFRTGGIKLPPTAEASSRPGTTENAPPTMWLGNRAGLAADWKAADNLEISRSEVDYKSGITTAFVCPNRGTIRGTGAVVDILPADAKQRVLVADAAMGMSFRGGTGQGSYPSNILGVIAQMRQNLYDAKTLAGGGDLGDEAKPNLKAYSALAPVVNGTMPVVFDATIDRELGRALRLSDEFGFKLMLTGARDAGLLAPTLAERKIPVIISAEQPVEPSASSGVPEAIVKERQDRWKVQLNAPQDLVEAGVKIAFSSEGEPVSAFLENIRKAINAGLDKDDALRAITIGAAEIFGIADKVGTIQVGKRANLVLMTSDFAFPETTVKMTIVDGRLMYEAKEASK